MPGLTVSSVVSVFIGVAATIIANAVFTLIHGHLEFKNRCFFDAYNRRLAVYEDVVNFLHSGAKLEETSLSMSPENTRVEISKVVHELPVLFSRVALYGSPASRDVLVRLNSQIRSIIINPEARIETPTQTSGKLSSFFFIALPGFTEIVGKETGNDIVDEKITKRLEKAAKRAAKRAGRIKRHDDKAGDNLKGEIKNPD
jgi:hypothetical protein